MAPSYLSDVSSFHTEWNWEYNDIHQLMSEDGAWGSLLTLAALSHLLAPNVVGVGP